MKTISKENFFIEATSRFCSSLDITVSLARLRDYLKTVMPVDLITLDVYEQDLKCIRAMAVTKEGESIWVDDVIPLHEKTAKFLEGQKKNHPIVVNDISSNEDLNPILDLIPSSIRLEHDGKISAIGLPLTIEEKWIGNLGLVALGTNQYKPEHTELVTPLVEPFALVMSNCLQYKEILRLRDMLTDENRYLQQELRGVSGDVIGENYGLKGVMEMVTQTAPKDNPVLLFGETGTGKEVIANVIHNMSSRRNGPFIKVNCGAIPESLIDSELFGHEKGAFTGAVEQKRGRFERANKGTIFLDEIGELPPAAQVRLLRVIQNKEIERVGGTETMPVDIRIIAATHRNLAQMVTKNEFREDLFYRLNVFPILIPPLRQRKVDIPELVDYFVEQKSKDGKLKKTPKLAPGSIERMIAYDWPGNVRELENVVERALIRYQGGLLTMNDFVLPHPGSHTSSAKYAEDVVLPLDRVVAQAIQKALLQTNGRISGPKGAANLLQIHPNTLRSKMKKLGL
jgi:transcriptional regulator with GAF, ATPase, and Fis domain